MAAHQNLDHMNNTTFHSPFWLNLKCQLLSVTLMGLCELPKYFSEVFWEIELSQTPPTCLIIQQFYYGTQMRIAESCTKSQPCVARIELTITQPILNNQFFETQLINELSKQGWSSVGGLA